MLRKSFSLTLLIFLSFAAFAGTKDSLRLEQRGGNKLIVHRVVKAETLQSLAARYGVTESEILSQNPILSDRVFPGQIIRVPINEKKYGVVTVAPVLPLSSSKLPLAKTLPSPAPASPGAAPQVAVQEPVKPVVVPESKQVPVQENKEEPVVMDVSKYETYVVGSPQTVQHLAASFGADPNEIISVNNLKNYNLKTGQKIQVPIQYREAMLKAQASNTSGKSTPNTSTTQVKTETKPTTVAAKPEPKPAPTPVASKSEPKPEPKPATVVAKQESKPTAMPPVAGTSNNNVTKPSTIPAVAGSNSSKNEAATSENADPDSIDFAKIKRQRNVNLLMTSDSDYVVPDGVAYKVFDYKQLDYQYDLYTSLLAEHNAIDVASVYQTKGKGDKNTTHVVKQGETLQSIARKYKVSATDLINWNGLLSYRVREGQDLIVNTARAKVTPYERTLPKKPNSNMEPLAQMERVDGLSYFDSKKRNRGVYVNNVTKGKFVYIISNDNYLEHFARVLGPLPKGTPDGVVIVLDQECAEVLKVGKSFGRVSVFFDIFEKNTAENK
jgi:LysM repeat protein